MEVKAAFFLEPSSERKGWLLFIFYKCYPFLTKALRLITIIDHRTSRFEFPTIMLPNGESDLILCEYANLLQLIYFITFPKRVLT